MIAGLIAFLTSGFAQAQPTQDMHLPQSFISIPGGSFLMGNNAGADNEKPAHPVTISSFKLSISEVTVAEFRAFISETNYITDAERSNGCYGTMSGWNQDAYWGAPEFPQAEDHPVVCVSYYDAQQYIEWLNSKTKFSYRLPSEAEWEYAARAGNNGLYPWGTEIVQNQANCLDDKCGDSFSYTAPIESFASNPFGLFDMSGNAWEWTADCWNDNYDAAPDYDGRAWLQGDCERGVVRGGAWLSEAANLQSAFRAVHDRDSRSHFSGFRLVQNYHIDTNNPIDENWWPSEFGADDQAGATNYITPQKRIEAAQLVKQGKIAPLGEAYSQHMPLVPGRIYNLNMPSTANDAFPWSTEPGYKQTFMSENFEGVLAQIGTQWDSMAHALIRIEGVKGWKNGDYAYNKRRLQDIHTPVGMTMNGAEQAGSFFTRGILIDIAALKKLNVLPDGYAITLDDYFEALKFYGINDATQGDVVLFRTGHNSTWKTNHLGRPSGSKVKSDQQVAQDNAAFYSASPGVSLEVCEYLAAKKVAMVGNDSWGLDPHSPDASPDAPFSPCHMNLLTRYGIYIFESMNLDKLSADHAYEFLFSWAPLKLVGATGSPGNPVAAY